MSGRVSKPRKRKGSSKAPPDPAPTSKIPKLKLRIPPLSTATVQIPPESPTTPTIRAPSVLPTQGQVMQNSQDTDMYIHDSYPSPRQQMINQFREDEERAAMEAEEVSASEPKLATSHPQNVNVAPPSVLSGAKRKVLTGSLDHVTSDAVNHDGSDDGAPSDSDNIISTQHKRAKIRDEPIEVEDSDELEGLDRTVTKTKQRRKKKNSDEEDEINSYKNSETNRFDIYKSYLSFHTAAFVLFIPRAAGSARRIELDSTAGFNEALEVIYENIGCVDVMKKPVLSYKLSTAAAKIGSISLDSTGDWKGFQKEVISQQRAKKRSIPVNILVSDRVCALLFYHRLLCSCLSHFST
jgi:hypothetical protein